MIESIRLPESSMLSHILNAFVCIMVVVAVIIVFVVLITIFAVAGYIITEINILAGIIIGIILVAIYIGCLGWIGEKL